MRYAVFHRKGREMSLLRFALMFQLAALMLIPSVSGAAGRMPYEDIAKKMTREGLTSTVSYQFLSDFIAAAPSRQSGSAGAQKAVEWAKAKMEELGLSNVRLEPAMVTHWERGNINTLRAVGKSGGGQSFHIIASGGSVPTPAGGITADVVEVHSKAELEALGVGAKGKIVFVNEPMDAGIFNTLEAYGKAGWQRSRAPSMAAKLGAVATVSRSLTTEMSDIPFSGMLHYSEDAPRIPAAAIATSDAERLGDLLKKGPVRLRLDLNCSVHPKAESYNVIGEIVGSERPKEIVLIGAHLDNWDNTPGANDDASGVAHVLEAMRLVRGQGLVPKRTIRAVLFMDEENGGLGGKDYAASERRKGERHIAAIESDLGGAMPTGFSVDGKRGDYRRLAKWAHLFRPLDVTKFEDGDSGVDIWKLAEQGALTAGMMFDMHRYFNYHHSPKDTPATIDPRELETGAIAMGLMAYVLAQEGI
jgi:Zn-dependent M28 family amino/carboxypeptidase